MIAVRAAANVKPDNVEDFKAVALTLVEETRKESGNFSYDFGSLAEEGAEGQFSFIERWESQEALDAHMQSQHFVDAVNQWEKYLATPLDVAIYDIY